MQLPTMIEFELGDCPEGIRLVFLPSTLGSRVSSARFYNPSGPDQLIV